MEVTVAGKEKKAEVASKVLKETGRAQKSAHQGGGLGERYLCY